MNAQNDSNFTQRRSILIVDDEIDILTMFRELLDSEYIVCCTTTGEDALVAMHLNMPDLVLMDVSMPGMGGIETLRIIRSIPLLSAVPVIIMSGIYPYMSDQSPLWNAYLEKPFTPSYLTQLIADLLSVVDTTDARPNANV